MNQTRLVSLVEQVLNVGSGFLVSLAIWQTVGPLFGYHVTWADNLGITTVFTVVSVARGYLWRRFFNAGLHAAVVTGVRSLYRRF